MAKEVFISYSRKDYEKVRAVKEEIDRLVGINCWMDINGIESGEWFKKVIISAINSHDTLLFMLTPHSMNSSYALKELGFATSKEKRIVLVDIEHTKLNDEFLFDYSDKDNIDWNDPLQHDKLIDNLKTWFCPQKSETKKQISGTNSLTQTSSNLTDSRDFPMLLNDSYVCSGATLRCSMGTSQAKLTVLPSRTVFLTGRPMANISDHLSFVNLAPFGRCRSIGFPATASATAANNGSLTPMPCVHNTPFPWMGGKNDYLVKGNPALLKSSQCQCMWGGTISIINDGQKDTSVAEVPTSITPPQTTEQHCTLNNSHSVDELYELGRDYYYGWNDKLQDYTESAKWYRIAAEQGHILSQYNLGRMYQIGLGVTQSEIEAVKWFRKAAEQGDKDAKNKLKELKVT